MAGRRRWVPVTLLGVALTVAALYALEVVAEAGGHSLDPTDPMNYNSYALRNDLSSPAYVHMCADTNCAQLDPHGDWLEVTPGAADEESVYWGSSVPTVYAVASAPSPAGPRRCLVLNAAHKAPGTTSVPLSSAQPCHA
jgi:hypothetical protein